PVPRRLGIFQRYTELLQKLASAFPCALTLYNIYIYNHQNPLSRSAPAPEGSALEFGKNYVYIAAALWHHRGHHVGEDDHAYYFWPQRSGQRGHAHVH